MNVRIPALPKDHDYQGLEALASAVAAEAVPPILQHGLQGHDLHLRIVLCAPGAMPTVRSRKKPLVLDRDRVLILKCRRPKCLAPCRRPS